MSWKGLRHKGVEVLFPEEWNASVDALDELYGWLTGGDRDINVANVYASYGYFSGLIYSEGRPVIRDGDPVNIYDIFQPARDRITQAIDQSAAAQYLGSISNKINAIAMDAYGRVGVVISEPLSVAIPDLLSIYDIQEPAGSRITSAIDQSIAAQYLGGIKSKVDAIAMDAYGRVGVVISEPLDEYGYVRTSVYRIDYSPVVSKLDEIINNTYDLKPARSTPTLDLSSYSLAGGDVVGVTKTNLNGWGAIVVSVRVTYATAATAGVRVRWLYSPDGTNYDSPEEAEAKMNYEDLTFSAGATKQRTIMIPILAPYVRIQIANLDTINTATITMWSWLVR